MIDKRTLIILNALESIAHPVEALQRQSNAEGCTLDPYYAEIIAKDATTLQGWAQIALHQWEECDD